MWDTSSCLFCQRTNSPSFLSHTIALHTQRVWSSYLKSSLHLYITYIFIRFAFYIILAVIHCDANQPNKHVMLMIYNIVVLPITYILFNIKPGLLLYVAVGEPGVWQTQFSIYWAPYVWKEKNRACPDKYIPAWARINLMRLLNIQNIQFNVLQNFFILGKDHSFLISNL